MTNYHEQLVKWIRDTVEYHYHDDIALVLVYGSYVTKSTHRLSDVDTYFIPKTDKGLEFARTFILNGIGYDIFPMRWRRVERIASIAEPLLPLLGDSIILFSSSKEDEERFLWLRDCMNAHLQDSEYMHQQAQKIFYEAFKNMLAAKSKHTLHDVRLEAGRSFLNLSNAIAYANGTYFHRGLNKHFDDLSSFSKIPDDFLILYEKCIHSNTVDSIINILDMAVTSTSKFLNVPFPIVYEKTAQETPKTREIDYDELVSFYEELVSTINKIWINTDNNDWRMAYVNGISFCNSLKYVQLEFGLEPMPVLESYNCEDLSTFLSSIEKAEKYLVHLIETGGGRIHRYRDFESFIKENIK